MHVHVRRAWALGLIPAIVLAGCIGAPPASTDPSSPTLTPDLKPELSDPLPTNASNETVEPEPAPEPTPPAPAFANVSIEDRSFNPTILTVVAGTTVTWSNLDRREHTVTHLGGLFDSGVMGRDAAYNHTFNDPGTYFYVCGFHDDMFGRVIVTEA